MSLLFNNYSANSCIFNNNQINQITYNIGLIYTSKKLDSISIKTNPSKTYYCHNDSINTSGMVILLSYNNGTTKEISSGFSISPTVVTNTGSAKTTKSITVSYTEGSVTKTTAFNVFVYPEYMELHIGTPRYSGGELTDPQGFIIGHNLIPQPASSSSETEYYGNGFTLYALKPQNSKYGWQTMAVNGGIGTNSKYLSKSTSKTNPYFGITFPFGVMVKTITIVDASDSAYNIRSGSIKAGNSSSSLSATLVSSFSRASNYGKNTTLTTTLTVNSSTAYRHIRMVASSNNAGAWGRADGSYYERSLTELMMTATVKSSDYLAWKTQYNLNSNTLIP